MRIQSFPDSVKFDSAILWQYENASALKRICSLFNDMMEYCSVRPWHRLTNSLNLDWSGWQSWENFDKQNNRVGGLVANGYNTISFVPSYFGMTDGCSIRKISIRERDTMSDSVRGLQVGRFRVKIYSGYEQTAGSDPTYTGLIATSGETTVGPSDYNKDIVFEFASYNELATVLSPDTEYYLSLEKYNPSNGSWVLWQFTPSVFYSAETYDYWPKIVDIGPTPNTSQPIVQFWWYDTANMSTDEMSLLMIATLFGIENPGYIVGSDEGISLSVFRRYLKSMIYLMDSNGSCKDLNEWASQTFTNTITRIADNQNMSINYQFDPALEGEDLEVYNTIVSMGGLPHPAGVGIGTEQVYTDRKFALYKGEGSGDNLGGLNSSRFADPDTPLPNGSARTDDANYTP